MTNSLGLPTAAEGLANIIASDNNPHNFDPELIEALADTSGRMYDEFYDLLADYQFDFTLPEKLWLLERVMSDIREVTTQASEENE